MPIIIDRPEPTIESVREFIEGALSGFVSDPASSDFQRGYFAALAVIATEALGMEFEDDPLDPAEPPPRGSHLRVVQ